MMRRLSLLFALGLGGCASPTAPDCSLVVPNAPILRYCGPLVYAQQHGVQHPAGVQP